MSDDQQESDAINAILWALVEATPEEYQSIELIARRPEKFNHRLQYSISCPDFPDELISYPTSELHQATYLFMEAAQYDTFEFRVKSESGGWSYNTRSERLELDDVAEQRRRKDEGAFALEAYDARQEFFESHLRPFPEDIIKVGDVHWEGGGLIDMELSSPVGTRACFTFGLSNPDLPSPVKATNVNRAVEESEGQEVVQTSYWLERTVPRYVPPEFAGCGYEVLILYSAGDDRSLGAVMWFAQCELIAQQELVESVLEHEGLTIESVPLLDGTTSDFVVYPACDWVPPVYRLPNGDMNVLIATSVTRAEMNFARAEGRKALIRRLQDAGIGQMSIYDRDSVV